MLVMPDQDSWLIVPQPEHAAHAARLAAHWRRPDWAPESLWSRFLTAVRRHDDGWRAAERRPAIDPHGQPVHFTGLDTSEHLQLLLAGIDQLSSDDLYAGLLTALHFRYLETHLPDDDPTSAPLVQRFLDRIDDRIDGALQMLGKASPAMQQMITPERLDLTRKLLSALDALSLRLLGGLPWQSTQSRLPVDDQTLSVEMIGDGRSATLAPWPMGCPSLEVTAAALRLPLRPYATRIALAEALREAEPITLTTRLGPG